MNSTLPPSPEPGTPDPSFAPQFGAPENAAVPAPPAKKRRKWFIAAGCGCLAILALAIAGCTAIVATSSDDGEEPTSTTEAAPAVTEEDTAEEDAVQEDVAAEEEGSEDAAEDPASEEPADEAAPAEDDVPSEYTSALNSAETYSEIMHMSKQGLFDQLTSEYADQFSEEAAQYAVDNIEADWNDNALKSAESYSDTLHLSKQGIYDQLTSEYGDKFTAEQAQYAIDTIEADWNQNALESARSYRDTMDMSPEAIRDQLSSPYGDQFTQEQADYAVENLDG